MMSNTTNKFAAVTTDLIDQDQLEGTIDLPLPEQECTGVMSEQLINLNNIVECNSSLISHSYDPIKFNKAVRAICNEYGLQEHEVEGPLLDLHVFGVDTRKFSTEAIINLWDDHCYSDAANDCDFDDGFDAA